VFRSDPKRHIPWRVSFGLLLGPVALVAFSDTGTLDSNHPTLRAFAIVALVLTCLAVMSLALTVVRLWLLRRCMAGTFGEAGIDLERRHIPYGELLETQATVLLATSILTVRTANETLRFAFDRSELFACEAFVAQHLADLKQTSPELTELQASLARNGDAIAVWTARLNQLGDAGYRTAALDVAELESLMFSETASVEHRAGAAYVLARKGERTLLEQRTLPPLVQALAALGGSHVRVQTEELTDEDEQAYMELTADREGK
jgi:hypothetical protein